MTLRRYHSKRNFRRTPEPRGRTVTRKGGGRGSLRFVVQKHAASRLHYDFRLEMGGVLKSWAVPKGPSLNPADKRLAVHVEDHPMEYRSFEGTIPPGEYGAGTVMIWDTGTWKPAGTAREPPESTYKKGKLEFILDGKKLKGEWHLVRMGGAAGEDGKNWLLLKARDGTESTTKDLTQLDKSVKTGRSMEEIAAKSRAVWHSKEDSGDLLPDFVSPELATLTKDVPATEDWEHEIKFDGYRILARIEGGKVRLLTRTGQDWTGRFPGVAQELAGLPVRTAMIDGEIVKLKPDGISSFQDLQNSLSDDGIADDVDYYAFDLLHLDGRDLRKEPLKTRRKTLEDLLKKRKGEAVRFSEGVTEKHAAVFRVACSSGLEGLVSKRLSSPYLSARTRDWLKTKCHKEQEFVIVGFTDPKGGRTGFGALLMGVREGEWLRYAGMVGTGFTRQSLAELHRKLQTLERRDPVLKLPPDMRSRKVHWVEPRLVAEMEFTEWTEDGRARHPSFKGLREDKPAAEVTEEKLVRVKKNSGPETIAGVRLTHPDKILYPEQGITKRDLALYYVQVADRLLPYLKERPLSLVRCPEGSGKKCFYQKHVSESTPEEIDEARIRESDGSQGRYVVVNDVPGLVAVAQMGVLEIHPWGARRDDIEHPDVMTIDLDPAPDVPWSRVVEAASLLHSLLEALKLRSFAKTTGGKGLHVVVPLARRHTWDEVKGYARALAQAVAEKDPRRYTSEMSKSKRIGKIFIDYLRNTRGATAVAPYSTRAKPGAPVAAPVFWEELDARLDPASYNIKTIPARLKELGKDPWKGFFSLKQTLKTSFDWSSLPRHVDCTEILGERITKFMPEKRTVRRAKKKMRKGYAPTTAAGEFVHEEIHHVRGGKHGAKNPKQAIAIGLSKARRAGVPVPPQRGR